MNPLRRMMLRARAILARRRLENDMQAEMREHLERATERLIARGLSPHDARAEARREFGNLTILQEDARDARGAQWVEALVSDLRFAFRYFAHQRLTTITIVLVLSLGIGANSAIFNAIQAETSRPAVGVPKDPSHVRIFGLEQPRKGERWQLRDFTHAELQQLAARTEAFSAVSGWMSDDVVLDAADSSGARAVPVQFVTPNFFATVGVPLVAGPGFGAHDPVTPDFAAVMSFAMAEQLYGTPTAAIGRRILVNEMPLRVVGVAPPRFQGAIPGPNRPALWLPVSARANLARLSPPWLFESASLTAFGRLAPSATRELASAVARNVVVRGLPDSAARAGMARNAEVLALRAQPPIADPGDEGVMIFVALGTIALLILLVACTNVSSLMVSAAMGRRQEIAVRLSLGASRLRLVRQFLTESALLALAGGVGGLLLYWWLTTLVASRVNVDIEPDLGTVAFTMAFALGTGILFGLSPALHATRDGVAGALRDSGAGATRRSRLQRGFVVAQIVFSQPLLVLLGVILSLNVLERGPRAGAASEHIVSAEFRIPERSDSAGRRAVESLIPILGARPGVVTVMPESRAFAVRSVTVDTLDRTTTTRERKRVLLEGAPPGYFALLDIPILLGRDIVATDTTSATYHVVVGNDLARKLWGDANPIGKRLSSTDWWTGKPDTIAMSVVGVYDATHATTRGGGTRAYTARGKLWRDDALLIRTSGRAQALVPEMQKLLRAEARAPLTSIETLAGAMAEERRVENQVLAMILGAGALALLLASLGLYGVVALAVTQRKREVGIRIAVGGKPARVARMFFTSGVRLSVIALLVGLPISLAFLRILLSQGVLIAPNVRIWPIGVGIAVVLLTVSSAASWFPARRAATIDPALTLRSE